MVQFSVGVEIFVMDNNTARLWCAFGLLSKGNQQEFYVD